MKNNTRLLTLIVLLAVFMTAPVAAGNLMPYWDNGEESKTIDPSEDASYYIDYIANSWANTIDVEVTLFDDTANLKNKGVIYEETGIDVSNDPFYFSPELTITQDDYEFSGDYFLDIKINQTNNDGSTTVRSNLLHLTVTGERALNADFTFTPSNPTEDDTITFTSTSTVEGNEIVLEEWFIDENKIAEGPQTTTQLDAGSFDVTLQIEDSQGRTDTETKTVTVEAVAPPQGPSAEFSFNPTNPKVNEEVTFTDESTAGDAQIVSWEWQVDGTTFSNQQNPTNTFEEAGTFQVSLTVTDENNLQDTTTQTIHVQQLEGPSADFEFQPENPKVNQQVTFTSTSTEGDSPIQTYRWFVDGQLIQSSTSSTFTTTFEEAGNKQIRHQVIDQNGLSDDRTKTINVDELQRPTADFSFTPESPEVDETVQFTDESTPGDAQITNWEWQIDGTFFSDEQNPTRTMLEAGTFEISLTVTDENDLSSTVTKPVTVSGEELQRPTADFSFTPTNPEVDEQIQFTDQSTPGDGQITSWEWQIDGTFFSDEQNPTRAILEAGTFNISLTVTDENDLSSTITKPIHVSEADLQEPNADFNVDPQNPVAGENIEFTDASTAGDGEIVQWTYTKDGDVFSTNPDFVTSLSEGTYEFTLTVTDENDLTDSITKTVTVQATPELEGPTANFRFNPQNPEVNEDVLFQSLSEEGDATITNYDWTINGEQASTQEEFTTSFDQTGNYQVTLTVTDANNLEDSITKTVTISEEEATQLILDELSANRNVVQGHLQHISGHVSDNLGNDVEDATITYRIEQTGQTLGSCETNFKGFCHINPTINLEPGFYEVSAIAEKPGLEPDLTRELRTIFQVWEQRYTIKNLETWEDEFLTLNDTFFRGNSVYASFDIIDDFTGDEITPPTDLITDVKLRVNNIGEGGFDPIDILQDGEELEKVGDEGNFRYKLPMIPLTDDFLGDGKVFAFAFNFTDETAGQASKDVTILNNPIEFNPPSTIELEEGETKTIDFKEFVNDVETPTIDVTFTFEQQNNIRILDQGDNVFDAVSRAGPGTFPVQVTADDNDGSQETKTINFVVAQTTFEGPNADFSFNPQNPQAEDTVQFTDESTAGDAEIVSWEWQVDDEPTLDVQNPEIIFAQEGSYDVRLTVTDENDLTDTITKTIQVESAQTPRENPNADFIYEPNNPRVGDEVTFTSNSTDPQDAIELKEWFIGDQKVAEGNEITNAFTSPDNYTVRLRVTNDAGLQDQRIQTVEVLPREINEPQGPTANLNIPTNTYEGRTVVLNASQSTGEIEEYRFTIRRGDLTLDSLTTTNPEPTYVFQDTGRLTVILTVTDTQGRTDTTSQTIFVAKEYRNDLPDSTIEDLRLTNTQVIGDDLNEVTVNDVVTVATQVSNTKSESIQNLRVSFEIPELAYKQKGNSFNLASNTAQDRSFSFRLQPGYYQPGEYIAQVVVSNTKEKRTKTVPIIIN